MFHEAVTVFGAVINTLYVSAVPDPSPVQFENLYCIPVSPAIAPLASETVAVLPVLYHPPPFGEPNCELTVRQYCSCQLKVIVCPACRFVNVQFVPEVETASSKL